MTRTRRALVYCSCVFGVVCGVLVALTLVAVGRTLTLKEIDEYLTIEVEELSLNDESLQRYVKIFGGSIKFQTVSTEPGIYDVDQLLQLQSFLIENYPSVFKSSFIDFEIVNNYSFLLNVKGSDSTLTPFMLTSHLDVVPVDPEQWSRPPFLGEVVPDPDTGEPCIWGRGAIDDKSGVIGILSAIDFLILNNWKPVRSFYVAFGHDEEVTGYDGAGHIAKILSERNVKLDFLLDEGVPIVQGVMSGLSAPIALIGVTEKGRIELRLSAEGVGGHSSIPPKVQAVEMLSNAVSNLYKSPQPSMFGSGPEKDMLKYLAPKASWPYKLLFANTWLFGPLISLAMSLKSETNAFLRTTTAVTIMKAGYKSNVVPATAWAVVNHRVHPSQSLDDVVAHDIAAIANDKIKVERLEGSEPHPVSSYGPDSIPFTLIAGALKSAYPDVITAPGLNVANTDTIHYLHLTSNIYRITPVILNSFTVSTIHGKNERLSLSNFRSIISFYKHLIQTSEKSHQIKFPKPGRNAGEL